MQFTKLILAAAALAVTSAVEFTNPTFSGIVAGSPFNVSWSGASGAVTLTLKNGDVGNLQLVSTIASGLTGTSYSWIPSTSLPTGFYALEIQDSTSTPNYSPQFTLTGSSATASLSSYGSSLSSLSSTTSIYTSVAGNLTSSATAATTGNSTATHATKSGSATGSSSKTGSATGSGSTGTSTSAPNSAAGIASPLAMVFLALAAIVCLN